MTPSSSAVPSVAAPTLGQTLDFSGMSTKDMVFAAFTYLMDRFSDEVDDGIQALSEDNDALRAANDVLSEMTTLVKEIGSATGGRVGEYLNNVPGLELRINDALREAGLTPFSTAGRLSPETPFTPSAPQPTTLTDADREFLRSSPRGESYVERYDYAVKHQFATNGTVSELHSTAYMADGLPVFDPRTQPILDKIGALNRYEARTTQEFQNWARTGELYEGGVSATTPVSDVFAAMKRIEGDIASLGQQNSLNMTNLQQKTSELNFVSQAASSTSEKYHQTEQKSLGQV